MKASFDGEKGGRNFSNILTFDVEDWYQSLDIPIATWSSYQNRLAIGLDDILNTLATYKTHATFFVLGWTAAQNPDLIRRIAASGHEIASHGWSHTPIYRQLPAVFREELRLSIDTLQQITGQPIKGHRAAFFSITRDSLWAIQELEAAGIAYDSSIFPVYNYRYGIPDAPRFPYQLPQSKIWEIPLSTLRLGTINIPFSGGFYARFWAYSLLKYGIKRLNKQYQPAIFYFHPWEFDPPQPRLSQISYRTARFTHYHRLHRTGHILERLLQDFRWITVRDYLSNRLFAL